MKKVIIAALVLLIGMEGLNAQNKFRGIVKFKIESTGHVAVTIPAEAATLEVKVYDDNAKIEAANAIQNGMRQTQAVDLAQLIAYLAANDITLETYQGDGKILIRETAKKETIDSLEIVDTEPGHYYYEYLNETKEILGYTAKKLVIHSYNEEGADTPTECWVTSEIGPETFLLFGNTKGFPLVYTQVSGDGKAITYTATEIVSGKVKEADMYPPAGYKDLTEEEFQALQEEIKTAAELLED